LNELQWAKRSQTSNDPKLCQILHQNSNVIHGTFLQILSNSIPNTQVSICSPTYCSQMIALLQIRWNSPLESTEHQIGMQVLVENGMNLLGKD
jgi:hypothetical protein